MLTIKEVEHIAQLAHLELTQVEKEKLVEQLSSILSYVEKLGEVNTEGVAETSQVTGLVDVLREDESKKADDKLINGILNNAPDKEEKLFKVKSILK